MSQKTVSMTFFTEHYTRNFFVRESVCSGKHMFSPFVKIFFFFTKTIFSLHITHTSVDFTWFVILNHQKLNDRPLFKPYELSLVFHHFE